MQGEGRLFPCGALPAQRHSPRARAEEISAPISVTKAQLKCRFYVENVSKASLNPAKFGGNFLCRVPNSAVFCVKNVSLTDDRLDFCRL